MYKWCWVLLIFVLLGSCLDNDVCLRGADNTLIFGFIKLSDGKADTVALYNIAATGVDSVFYKESGTDTINILPKQAQVTVNPYSDTTQFIFQYPNEVKTITVGYQTEVRFVSEDCGSERLQYDLKILSTDFDSVRVVRNNLNKGKSINIEIYN